MAQAFRDGVYVTRADGQWVVPRQVRKGRPDSDGDIQVWNPTKTDWGYVRSHLLIEVPAPAPQCAAPQPNHAPEPIEVGCAPQDPSQWVMTKGVCGAAPNLINSNQEEGTANMAKVARSLVHVALIDQDAGLDVSKSLVKDFGTMVQEGSKEELIQEILMDTNHNVESAIRGHNAMRVKEVDLDILQRTGNSAKLRAVKLKDLTWSVTAA